MSFGVQRRYVLAFVNAILQMVHSTLRSKIVASYSTDTRKLRAQTKRHAEGCSFRMTAGRQLCGSGHFANRVVAFTTLRMKINAGRTKILETNASQHVYLVNGEVLEKVIQFCHLTSVVADNLDMDTKVQRRIQSSIKAKYQP